MAPVVPRTILNDGTKIPNVGLGCWMGSPGGDERVITMVKTALKHGYTHFDTAAGYANEEQVGRAIRESGIPREKLYITTKLVQQDHDRVAEALEESLQKLGTGYVDMYLMHWPQVIKDGKILRPQESPTYIETWKDMEKLLSTGKVKSIGVSNSTIPLLTKLIAHCTVVPATNQVEMHPSLPRTELVAWSRERGISTTAYSPLGRPTGADSFLNDPSIQEIANRIGVTTAQVVLSWGEQRGTIVVPKNENEDRMVQNITLVNLSRDDMATVDNYHKKPGQHKSLLTYHQPAGICVGWSYQELGWEFDQSKPGMVKE